VKADCMMWEGGSSLEFNRYPVRANIPVPVSWWYRLIILVSGLNITCIGMHWSNNPDIGIGTKLKMDIGVGTFFRSNSSIQVLG